MIKKQQTFSPFPTTRTASWTTALWNLGKQISFGVPKDKQTRWLCERRGCRMINSEHGDGKGWLVYAARLFLQNLHVFLSTTNLIMDFAQLFLTFCREMAQSKLLRLNLILFNFAHFIFPLFRAHFAHLTIF